MNDVRDLRRKNKRRKYRRRRTGFVFAVFSFLVILAAVVAAMTVFFKISDIKITGQTRYSEEEILEASGIETGTNMFMINKFASINRMFSKLYYLDEVRVRRRLPDTVEIIVSDTEPVTSIRIADEYWLMDKRCKLLETVDEQKAKEFGILEGLEVKNASAGKIIESDDQDKLSKLKEFLTAAYDGGVLKDIKDINFEKLYDVSFRFEDRFTVNIGSTGDYERKFRFLLSVSERLSPTDRGEIDLSDPESAHFRPEQS